MIKQNGDLSDNQHGFWKGKSTISAIENVIQTAKQTEIENHRTRMLFFLATFGVKNAFGSIRWRDILKALEHRSAPDYIMRVCSDYLSGRVLRYETDQGIKTKRLTKGSAQGSILGPDFWLDTYDDIFNVPLPNGCELVGYADIAAKIIARNTEEAQWKLQSMAERIKEWMILHDLQIAEHKIEVVFHTKKKSPRRNT